LSTPAKRANARRCWQRQRYFEKLAAVFRCEALVLAAMRTALPLIGSEPGSPDGY
jgi:hypothetical protein